MIQLLDQMWNSEAVKKHNSPLKGGATRFHSPPTPKTSPLWFNQAKRTRKMIPPLQRNAQNPQPNAIRFLSPHSSSQHFNQMNINQSFGPSNQGKLQHENKQFTGIQKSTSKVKQTKLMVPPAFLRKSSSEMSIEIKSYNQCASTSSKEHSEQNKLQFEPRLSASRQFFTRMKSEQQLSIPSQQNGREMTKSSQMDNHLKVYSPRTSNPGSDKVVKKGFLPIPIRNKSKGNSQLSYKSNSPKKYKVPTFIRQKQYARSQRVSSQSRSVERLNISLKGLNLVEVQSIQKSEGEPGFQIQINIKPAVHKIGIDDFQLVKVIGQGSYGKAFMALQKNLHFICVLKILDKQKICQYQGNSLLRQIKIQFYLHHRNLTSLYGVFDDEDYIYLVQELLPSGNLKDLTNGKPLPQATVSQYMFMVCKGIQQMHNKNILHRDIKPQNVFTFGNVLKLGDFGCSVYSQNTRTSFVGSPAYLSPEQLTNQHYNAKVDIWEIGTLTYQLLFGKCPFEKDITEMMKGQRGTQSLSQLKFPKRTMVSDQAKDFLNKTLAKDPWDRITMDEVLQHCFLVQNSKQFQIVKDFK